MANKRLRWVLLGFVIALVLGGLSIAVLSIVGGVAAGGGRWEEAVIERGGPEKVAMITLSGEISASIEPFADDATAPRITAQLDQALKDPKVVSVILRLDTPGGAVVASDIVYRKVRELGREGKPVVALMEDVAASGGYYIAAGAREIVANPATLTGSIGVIMVIPNLEKAADKLGIRPVVIKSGPLKDIGSPLRTMTPEEQAILQGIINEAYEQFVGAVAEGRKLNPERVRQIADGRVYTGKQAKELGLVDRLGDRSLALERARKLGLSSDATLVAYRRRPSLLRALLGMDLRLRGPELLEKGLGVGNLPGLKFLWLP